MSSKRSPGLRGSTSPQKTGMQTLQYSFEISFDKLLNNQPNVRLYRDASLPHVMAA